MSKKLKKSSAFSLLFASILSLIIGVGSLIGNVNFAYASGSEFMLPTASIVGDTNAGISVVSLTTYDGGYNKSDNNKHVYSGLKIDTCSGDTADNVTVREQVTSPLELTFKGDTKIEYLLSQIDSKTWTMYGFVEFVFKDLNGREMFVVGRGAAKSGQIANGLGYFYDSTSGVYSTAYSAKHSKAGEMYTFTQMTYPTPNGPDSNNGSFAETYQGMLPRRFSRDGTTQFETAGYLKFDYDETTGKLQVKAPFIKDITGNNTNFYAQTSAITTFTTVEYVIGEIDLNKTGYEDVKFAIENGYKVEIRKDVTNQIFKQVPSVVILSLNDVALNSTSLELSVGSDSDIYYENEKLVDGKNVIEVAKGNELDKFTINSKLTLHENISVEKTTKEYFTFVAETFDKKEVGEYEITVSYKGVSKDYTVKVLPSLNALEFVEDTNATVSADNMSLYIANYKTDDYLRNYNGLLFNLNSGMSDATYQTAGLNVLLKGTSKMEYLLAGDTNGFVEIVVSNNNGEELFHIGRGAYQYADLTSGMGYFYNAISQKYTATQKNGVVKEWVKEDMQYPTKDNPQGSMGNHYQGMLPRVLKTGDVCDAGYLVFDYNSQTGILQVKAPYFIEGSETYIEVEGKKVVADYKKKELVIAEIDCNASGYEKVKSAMENGYKISFRKDLTNQVASSVPKVFLISLNGVEFNSYVKPMGADIEVVYENGYDNAQNVYYVAQNSKFDYKLSYYYKYFDGWNYFVDGYGNGSIKGSFSTENVGEYQVTVVSNEFFGTNYEKTLNVIVEPSFAISFDVNGGNSISTIYYSEHTATVVLPIPTRSTGLGWKFGGWYDGEGNKVETIDKDTGNLSLTAVWYDDVAPSITLNKNSVTVIEYGSDLQISNTDVSAEDTAIGIISNEDVKVFIKLPKTEEYISFDDFEFVNNLYGIYTIKYVVSDTSNNFAEVTRLIDYRPVTPKMTISGEVVTTGYVGKSITLPNATAISGDNQIDVSLTVVLNGNKIALSNNSFTPIVEGVYSVVYFAQDDYERIVAESFEINVAKDVDKPIINVDFNLTKLTKGDNLLIPVATAIDNIDGEVNVTVNVFINGEKVSKIPSKAKTVGIYTIEYVAVDESGNRANLVFEVLVGEKAGCKSEYNANALSLVCLACAVCCYFTLKAKRKRNK